MIPFSFNSLGRVDFLADVMTNDAKSFGVVRFKLDSGSDFTTIDCEDLYNLGVYARVPGGLPFPSDKRVNRFQRHTSAVHLERVYKI